MDADTASYDVNQKFPLTQMMYKLYNSTLYNCYISCYCADLHQTTYPVLVLSDLLHLEPFGTFTLGYLPRHLHNNRPANISVTDML